MIRALQFQGLGRHTEAQIYTLAGDLVQEATQNTSSGSGTYYWNMITRNGQNVVSGVYVFSVQYSGGTCRGRFVIIR